MLNKDQGKKPVVIKVEKLITNNNEDLDESYVFSADEEEEEEKMETKLLRLSKSPGDKYKSLKTDKLKTKKDKELVLAERESLNFLKTKTESIKMPPTLAL